MPEEQSSTSLNVYVMFFVHKKQEVRLVFWCRLHTSFGFGNESWTEDILFTGRHFHTAIWKSQKVGGGGSISKSSLTRRHGILTTSTAGCNTRCLQMYGCDFLETLGSPPKQLRLESALMITTGASIHITNILFWPWNLIPLGVVSFQNGKASGARKQSKRGRKPAKIDVKAKLERSRQSARECRARKKLRYQYLEELVASRERAVFQLRGELEQVRFLCHCVQFSMYCEKKNREFMRHFRARSQLRKFLKHFPH